MSVENKRWGSAVYAGFGAVFTFYLVLYLILVHEVCGRLPSWTILSAMLFAFLFVSILGAMLFPYLTKMEAVDENYFASRENEW